MTKEKKVCEVWGYREGKRNGKGEVGVFLFFFLLIFYPPNRVAGTAVIVA